MRSVAGQLGRIGVAVGMMGGLLAGLAACASHAPQTQFAAPDIAQQQQEAAAYLARARAKYQPPGPPGDPWGPYVAEASKRFDVPPAWIHEVMQVESAGYQFRATGELTTSPVGAMGLMQLMPETYDEMRGRYTLGADAYEPHDNILAGTAYLREMYDAFGSPAFLAAYNAGPARLQEYLVHNRPLPDETRRYVWMIGSRIQGEWPQTRSPAEQLAVNHLPLDIPAGPRWVVHHAPTRLAARARRRHEAAVRYAAAHRSGHAHQAPIEVAEAPEPRPVRLVAGTPSRHAAHHGWSLHLIEPAMASEHVAFGRTTHWAVQVGGVKSGHATAHRARLGGLTHDRAVAVCRKLSHCVVVSPASR